MTIRTEKRLSEGIAWALLLGLCVWALRAALAQAATQGWPFFHDAWRDISVAQGILDGRYPEDPSILGATLWYNPLAGTLSAAWAWLTGLTAAQANVAAGPWLNLLIPLGLFAFLRLGFGAWTAAAGTLFLLASNALHERTGIWVTTTTYSPWLWAPHLGQALLFVTLAVFAVSLRHPHRVGRLALGIAWGILFMAHTSPAIVFGAVYIVVTAWDLLRARKEPDTPLRTRLARAAVPIVTAFVASLPYTYSILWNYQFRMQNISPTRYVDYSASLERLPELLYPAANWTTAIAVIGFAALWRMRGKRPAARILLAWTLLALALLAQFYLNLLLEARFGWGLPQLVPGHHQILGLGGVKAALFGVGLAALASGAAKRLAADHEARQRTLRAGFGMAVIAAASALLLPAYARELHFSAPMDFGWHTASFDDRRKCVEWIVEHCPPDAVFLCDEQHTIRLVMPAARKAVLNIDIFSNPYVPYEARMTAKFAMYDALRAGDHAAFQRLAEEYRVTHLLVLDVKLFEGGAGKGRMSYEEVLALNAPYLSPAYHEDGIAIFRVSFEAAP